MTTSRTTEWHRGGGHVGRRAAVVRWNGGRSRRCIAIARPTVAAGALPGPRRRLEITVPGSVRSSRSIEITR